MALDPGRRLRTRSSRGSIHQFFLETLGLVLEDKKCREDAYLSNHFMLLIAIAALWVAAGGAFFGNLYYFLDREKKLEQKSRMLVGVTGSIIALTNAFLVGHVLWTFYSSISKAQDSPYRGLQSWEVILSIPAINISLSFLEPLVVQLVFIAAVALCSKSVPDS